MKILWISDSIDLDTGFGTQSLLITSALKNMGNEVVTMGWMSDNEMKINDIPAYPLYNSFSNSVSIILKQYYAFNPDVIISYADIHMVQHMIMDIRDNRFKDRWIHWLPIDGDPYPESHDYLFKDLRNLVVTSEFGEQVFKNHHDNLRTIFNAVDPNEFFPLKEKQLPKEFEGKFVPLFVGVNQARKKIPLLIDGFSKFAQDKNDVLLVLRTTPKSEKPSYGGWDLEPMLRPLRSKVVLTPHMSKGKLNKLNNYANLLVSATGGEGFNLPAVEAMMSGLPILLPNYTTGPEFVGKDSGDLIKISEFVHEGPLNLRKAIISTDDLADKLNYFYKDWKDGSIALRAMGANARQKALEKYSIQKIASQWNESIAEIHKKNSIKQINLTKNLRPERKIIFLDDLDPNQWVGGTQLSTKKIIDSANDFGLEAKCTTLEKCDLSDLYSADLVILNNIYETQKASPGLISEIVSNIPYIKWEHDFNFCHTRDFRCAGKKEDCQTECQTKKYVEIYDKALSVIFQSPLHYQAILSLYGEKIIDKCLILPPPINPDPFLDVSKKERKKRFLWTGLLHSFRGIEEAIEYAEQNPDKQFLFHSAYPQQNYEQKITSLPNCELLIKQIPYEEMPELFSSCTDLFYQPKYIDASSRTCLEALLSGCRLRPNKNVGLLSYDWDWTDKEAIANKVKEAPKIFWDHIKEHVAQKKPVTAAKMNIVFFPSGGTDLPSSRIRIYTVAEILEKFGYSVQVIDADLPDEIKYGVISSLKPNDIVYVQKTFSKFNKTANFKHIKGHNVIIYDVDDFYEERDTKGKIQHMFNSDQMAILADMVIVGSHRLEQWNKKYNKNIKTIPSLVDETIYKYKAREPKEPHQITILWTEKNGKAYIDDLMMVRDVLDEIHRKYGCAITFQSFKENEIKDVQELFPYVRVLQEVKHKDYVNQRIPMMQDCDFFIAPFSSSGEGSVEKQYKAGQNSRHIMAMGIPGVATPTGEHDHFIEDGVNGFLATTKQEWFEKIEKMVLDNALRIQMGYKSRETIEEKYVSDKTVRKVLEAVHSIKNKYYSPTIELGVTPQFKAIVTIKYGSSGGGTLTSKHIKDILENIGYRTQLVHCDRYKGSKINYVYRIDEKKLETPMPLREYSQKYPVDVIYFDDVQRLDKESIKHAKKSFLVLCGCANVHEEYYTDPTVLSGAPGFEKVFVKNYSLYKYLNSLFGDRFVYWQGGIDGQQLRNQFGRASYRHPKDGVLLTSSFSKGWWKNPIMSVLGAFAIWKKYPKTKYFKPIITEQDAEFSKYSGFKILGNTETMQREQVIETLARSQLGLEIYLADAFPRTLLDYFSLGVPMITSDAITFLNEFPILKDNLVVQNPNDPWAIYQKAVNLLEDQEKWETVSAACIEFTKIYSFQAESDILIKHSNLQLPSNLKKMETPSLLEIT